MDHKVVNKKEWLAARRELLRDEKAMTRLSDQLAARRRTLPWLKVETNYEFDDNSGSVTLAELFEGRSQLIVYHFMFAPEWEEGCPGCTMFADDFNGIIEYLNDRDASMVVVSRADLAKLNRYKERMGWRFRWVSSSKSDFNYDFDVSFRDAGPTRKMFNFKEYDDLEMGEQFGVSVFMKENDNIFHTYRSHARSCRPAQHVFSTHGFATQRTIREASEARN